MGEREEEGRGEIKYRYSEKEIDREKERENTWEGNKAIERKYQSTYICVRACVCVVTGTLCMSVRLCVHFPH